jgi:hypothetical protein
LTASSFSRHNLTVPSDPQTEAQVLLWQIVLLGVLGMAMIVALTMVWKRFNARYRVGDEPRPIQEESPVDPWELSGRRLTGDDPDSSDALKGIGNGDDDNPPWLDDDEIDEEDDEEDDGPHNRPHRFD